MKVLECIGRLAEIEVSRSIINMNEDVMIEREILIGFLKDMKVINIDEEGGFMFIGEDSNKNVTIFLDMYNSF